MLFTGDELVRLDELLRGRTAALTARCPDPGLLDLCRRHGVAVLRPGGTRGWPGHSGRPLGTARHAECGWVDVRVGDGRTARLRAPVDHPALTIIVRPDPRHRRRGHPIPVAAAALEHP